MSRPAYESRPSRPDTTGLMKLLSRVPIRVPIRRDKWSKVETEYDGRPISGTGCDRFPHVIRGSTLPKELVCTVTYSSSPQQDKALRSGKLNRVTVPKSPGALEPEAQS